MPAPSIFRFITARRGLQACSMARSRTGRNRVSARCAETIASTLFSSGDCARARRCSRSCCMRRSTNWLSERVTSTRNAHRSHSRHALNRATHSNSSTTMAAQGCVAPRLVKSSLFIFRPGMIALPTWRGESPASALAAARTDPPAPRLTSNCIPPRWAGCTAPARRQPQRRATGRATAAR